MSTAPIKVPAQVFRSAATGELHADRRLFRRDASFGAVTHGKQPASKPLRSPVCQAERIRRPLLIAQGANDPRVKQTESDQMVAAIKANGVPVAYVLFPDEGHGFARPENNLAFNTVTEAFLERHLAALIHGHG